MKLYFAPGACSLAGHIALHEGDFDFDLIKVDLKEKETESGQNYNEINPKGYVPALVLDGGEILTENVAILSWIADQRPALAPKQEGLGRYRLLESLAFISTELHKQFKPFFGGGGDDAKRAAAQTLQKRFAYLKEHMQGDYLFGSMSVADCYLFVMLAWANRSTVAVPHGLEHYFERIRVRPAVQLAFKHEKLE